LGEQNAISCPSNFIFHNTNARELNAHYKNKFPNRFKNKIGYNDGCPEQYKSKFAAFEMTHLCADLDIDTYIQCYPPTAQFKGPSDAGGNDSKLFVTREERAGNIRVTNAREFFLACEERMPKPINNKNTILKKFHISERHFRFVVEEEHMTPEMRANDHVVTLVKPHGDKFCNDLIGIRKMYQRKCTRALHDTRLISYRLIPCWCSKCEDHDFDNCVINSKWIQKDLAKARVIDAVVAAPPVVLFEVVVPPPVVIDIVPPPHPPAAVLDMEIGLSFKLLY
jgi:hypothetical protein